MNDGCRTSQQRRFNCHDQANPTWRQRAELCAELVGLLKFPTNQVLALADIGCGDQKLREMLGQQGIHCRYQGFDLLPQTPDVMQFDVRSQVLPGRYDVAVLLGVIEYLERIDHVFASLSLQVPWVVVSHVIRKDEYYTQTRLADLGWRNHFTEAEIGQLLESNGLTILQHVMTADNRTLLMVCHSQRFLDKRDPAYV